MFEFLFRQMARREVSLNCKISNCQETFVSRAFRACFRHCWKRGERKSRFRGSFCSESELGRRERERCFHGIIINRHLKQRHAARRLFLALSFTVFHCSKMNQRDTRFTPTSNRFTPFLGVNSVLSIQSRLMIFLGRGWFTTPSRLAGISARTTPIKP